MSFEKKYKKYIEKKLPKLITEEVLLELLKNDLFKTWGFSFCDLEEYIFDKKINHNIIRRIAFSTKTILPKDHPFNYKENVFKKSQYIQEIHNRGINGDGINIAVIDQGFDTIHNEINNNLKLYKRYYKGKYGSSFHGTTVSSLFVGKNIGVAPNANLYFFEHRCKISDVIKALNDIYKMNESGANIKVINISASFQRESREFKEIEQKLTTQGCYIIDSYNFGEFFTSINIDFTINGNDDYYFSEWQSEHIDGFKKMIAIPSGGKMLPLYDTENDYIYCGDTSYSWSIPILSGIFTLALQIDPNLTLEQFGKLAHSTRIQNEEGITLINPKGIIEEVLLQTQDTKTL